MATAAPTGIAWCPYCGTELPRTAVRCSNCGQWLPAPGHGEAAHPTPAADTLQPDQLSVSAESESESSPETEGERAEATDQPAGLPSFSQLLAAVSALGAIGAPLYFVGIWSLRERIQTIHHVSFWTAWYAANEIPRFVIVLTGLSFLLSPSLLVFMGVLLESALVQSLQDWIDDGHEDVLAFVQRLLAWVRRVARWHHSPRGWLIVACAGAVVVEILADILGGTQGARVLIALVSVPALLAFLAFYLEYALAAEKDRQLIYLAIAGAFIYLLSTPLLYVLGLASTPPAWTQLLGAAGTGLGAWLAAGLVRHDFQFSIRLVAVFLLAYSCAFVPSFVWVDRHALGEDLPLPHLTVCVGPRNPYSKTPAVPVTGTLVNGGDPDVVMFPDEQVVRNGKHVAIPGSTLVTIRAKSIEWQAESHGHHPACSP